MQTTYKILSDFLSNKMRMSHIYQPVMLMELLSNKGNASVEEIAKQLLIRDPSQIEYYSKITKEMPGRVLGKNHNLVTKDKQQYSLNDFSKLSDDEVNKLIELCQSKLNDYIERRGERIWQHRTNASGYIKGSIRYEVLKRAKFCCELCGISAQDRAIEVDHIIPRSKGGASVWENVVTCCKPCNQIKCDKEIPIKHNSFMPSYWDIVKRLKKRPISIHHHWLPYIDWPEELITVTKRAA